MIRPYDPLYLGALSGASFLMASQAGIVIATRKPYSMAVALPFYQRKCKILPLDHTRRSGKFQHKERIWLKSAARAVYTLKWQTMS